MRVLVLAVFLLSTSFANALSYKGETIDAFIDFAKADVYDVTTPFKLYHWDQGGQRPYWATISDPHDARFAQMIRNVAGTPFKHLGTSKEPDQMFGPGFYLSPDPVATRSYGGDGGFDFERDEIHAPRLNQPWQLTEMTLPAGFRFVSISHPKDFTPQVKRVLARFGCDDTLANSESLFIGGGSNLSKGCADFVRFVYQQTFDVDAIAYHYNVSYFETCADGFLKRPQDEELAFIITSGKHIQQQDVSVTHDKTRDDLKGRTLLQTLFAMNGSFVRDGLEPNAMEKAVSELLAIDPKFDIQYGAEKCMPNVCMRFVYGCPKGTKWNAPGSSCSSQYVVLPGHETPFLYSSDFLPYGLLWPDLEGTKRTSADEANAYLRANRLGCDGTARYRPSNF